MRFKDQTVIVTGGTRGIGAAITEAFVAEGACVYANFCGNEGAAKAFYQKIPQFSDRLKIRQFDVSNSEQVENFFAELDEKSISPHVLVNNAGIRRDSILGMLSESDWDAVIQTNLKGTFLMSKFAVQRMSRKRYGRIIQITSPSGRLGFSGQTNYGASKAGQVGLMRSLAQEVAKRKITVNCVSPGFIETDLIADLQDNLREKYKALIPLNRFGKTEEIAHAVCFLASEQAAYITNHVLEVTGGI